MHIGDALHTQIEYNPPSFLHSMVEIPLPEHYLLPTVFIWNPLTYFTMQCPLCSTPLKQHNGHWADGSISYKPRVLQSFRHIALLVSQVYVCTDNKALFVHDERLLKILPSSFEIPFILLHKTGYTKQFVEEILVLCRSGMNFYKIESMIIEARWDFYSKLEQKFWQDTLSYKASHPETLNTASFPPFTFDKGPLHQIPSNDAIAQCFLRDFLEKEQYYISEMASLKSSSWISCDHTFKVACNIGYLRDDKRWIQQYSSVFFVLDNQGRILSWQFTNTTSFNVVENILTNLHDRHGAGVIKEIFIDNCCQWRNKLQSVFGNETKVYLDLFHAIQRITRVLSKKHPLYAKCINDLRLIFRTQGDTGIKRCLPTPSPDLLLENADKFVGKWGKIQHDGLILLNDKAIIEMEKLKVHMRKGCLSNIGVSCGTNRNEALHRHINSFFHRSRMSTLLAYAIITVLLFSHNSAVEVTPRKIVKPISSCMALQYKSACQKYPDTIATCPNEYFGITPKELVKSQSSEIVYNQSQEDVSEENMFDVDTALNILTQAVQQAMVLNSMKHFNNHKQIGLYSVLSKCVEGLFIKNESDYTSNYTLLDNILKCNNLERATVSGDGNCCFMSVARGLKELIEQKHENDPFIVHLKSTELKLDSSCNELSLQLRKLTVQEWLGANQLHYKSFISDSSDIESDANKFLDPTYFQGSLGDSMILAMSNVLCIPIIIFSTIPNHSIIPVMPQKVLCDSLILVAYNHMGPGHYDAVVAKPKPHKTTDEQSKEPHCRCGINGDEPSCNDKSNYKSRCKCYKMKMGCTKACKCKNCSNIFGRRITQGKRHRESHANQIPVPNSKKFAEDRSEYVMPGPWTSLENAIFLFIIEDFKHHDKEITVENMLKAFNEIATLSISLYNYVDIPDNIAKPTPKSPSQMTSKLQHYFNEITYINECDLDA